MSNAEQIARKLVTDRLSKGLKARLAQPATLRMASETPESKRERTLRELDAIMGGCR